MFQQNTKTRELFQLYAAVFCGTAYSYILYYTASANVRRLPEMYIQADASMYPHLSRLAWLAVYLLVGFSAYALSHLIVWRTLKTHFIAGRLNFLFVSILGFSLLSLFGIIAFIWRYQLSLDGFDPQIIVVFPLVCLFWGILASIPILLFSLCGQLLVKLFSRQNSLP